MVLMSTSGLVRELGYDIKTTSSYIADFCIGDEVYFML
jgi:hypothetical protein